MQKLSHHGVMLIAVAMLMWALAMPSVAPGASWGVVGSEHTLDSTNFGFTMGSAFGDVKSSCSRS